MENLKELFNVYKTTDSWDIVDKSHENLFIIGAQSILYRGGELLNDFFNHKSDANKYLTAEQQEDLENEFSEYCANLPYFNLTNPLNTK